MVVSKAPYNFVPLKDEVIERYKNINELPHHNEIYDDLLSGEITYTITPKTPIFIGGPDGKTFYQLGRGKYEIPGSTVHGLVRSNMQILGLSQVGSDIEDATYMYRMVAGNTKGLVSSYKSTLGIRTIQMGNNSISITEKVKAGYIKCVDKDRYEFYECESVSNDGKTYYYVNETNFIDNEEDFTINPTLMNLYDRDGHEYNLNSFYSPYYKKVSYSINSQNQVNGIGKPDEFIYDGYIISSGQIAGRGKDNKPRNKKAVYIIPKINEAKPLEIDGKIIEKSVAVYKRDYNAKETSLGGTDEASEEIKGKRKVFYQLPHEIGDIRPVFYIYEGNILNFGYTPYLRIMYKNNLKHGIPDAHLEEQFKFDYAKSMLGFVNGPDKSNYEGRVYFKNASIVSGTPKESPKKYTLGEPKPSSYLDYLTQSNQNQATTYNDSFKIRGVKQYWLKNNIESPSSNQKNSVASEFNILDFGNTNGVFEGQIEFKNLSKDELGLLLWSIALNENSEQNLGKAKSYGFGRVKIELKNLKLQDYKKMYDLTAFNFEPVTTNNNYQEYITAYKQFVKEKYKIDIDSELSIKELLAIKNSKLVLPNSETAYMDINTEYKARNRLLTPKNLNIKEAALPTILDLTEELKRKKEEEEKLQLDQAKKAKQKAIEDSYKAEGYEIGTIKSFNVKNGRGQINYNSFISVDFELGKLAQNDFAKNEIKTNMQVAFKLDGKKVVELKRMKK